VYARVGVVRLQAALLNGKRTGVTELDGIGRLSWRETMSLIDIVLGMFWTETTSDELQSVWWQYRQNSPEGECPENGVYDARYGSLEFLTWLLDGWLHGAGSVVATDLLARWLTGRRNRISRHLGGKWDDPWNAGRNEIEPRIRERLCKLHEEATSARG
jgi:hypothetical protein